VLSAGCTVASDDCRWYLNTQGQPVFTGHSWQQGPQIKVQFQYGLSGQFATLDRSWLDTFLEQRDLKLAFALKHVYRIRESEYREYSTSSFAKLLNFSPVIMMSSNR
jgi:hypothetical protein